ncbi:MAG: polysaccharide deacetylase family protein [Paracoccaceae bacterium]
MKATQLRVVNYHLTPASRAATYDREFAALAARYAPVAEDDLAEYLVTGIWPMGGDGVLPVFYNGYRNNYDVARPLLEKHGLIGWFMAVTAYSSCPAADQSAFAATRTLATIKGEYADGRSALSWDELRALDGPHVVGSHTRNHTRVGMDDPAVVESEIVGAQDDFVRELGHPVRAFAWLHGGRYGGHPLADAAVDRAGYQFLFSNFAVQRLL